MEAIVSLLTTLNSLSPLAVIGLLGLVIFLLVKGKTSADTKLETVASNHLHSLPEIAEGVKDMSETLRRMEMKQSEEFSFIKARLTNGGGKH